MFNTRLAEIAIVNEKDKIVGILDIYDLRILTSDNAINLRESAGKFVQSIVGNSIKSYIDQDKTVSNIDIFSYK